MNKRSIAKFLTVFIGISCFFTPVFVNANTFNSNYISESKKISSKDEIYQKEHYLNFTDELNSNPSKKTLFKSLVSTNDLFPEKNGIVDLSDSPWFPDIGDQGPEGSCTSFASTYYEMSFVLNKKMNNSLENRITLSPRWTYNFCNDGSNIGTSFLDNYNATKNYGAISITDYPYIANSYTKWPVLSSTWLKAQKYSLTDNDINYAYVYTSSNKNYANIDAIKSKLRQGFVINIDFHSSSSSILYKSSNRITNAPDDLNSVISYCKNNGSGGHAATIVGYNDNVNVDINNDGTIEDNEKGVFKIADSNGTYGLNKGFIWVCYDALNKESKVYPSYNLNYEDRKYSTERGEFFLNPFMYWISDITINESEPKLYAEFTLNTNTRGKCKVSLSAKNLKTSEVSTFSYDIFDNNPDISFDGSSDKNDGSFALDLHKIIPNISSETVKDYCWSLHLEDTEKDDNSLILKDFKIIDISNNKDYTPSVQLPCFIDGTTLNIDINIVDEKKPVTLNKYLISSNGRRIPIESSTTISPTISNTDNLILHYTYRLDSSTGTILYEGSNKDYIYTPIDDKVHYIILTVTGKDIPTPLCAHTSIIGY